LAKAKEMRELSALIYKNLSTIIGILILPEGKIPLFLPSVILIWDKVLAVITSGFIIQSQSEV
jgi:hypothetical protein